MASGRILDDFVRHPDVVPNQPVLIQRLSAVPTVKAQCAGIGRFHIDANANRFLLNKPTCQEAKQFRCSSASATLSSNIDPLQFSIARVAAGEMSTDKANHGMAFRSHINDTGHQRLLRMEFAVQIPRNAGNPVSLRFPLPGSDSRQGGNVRKFDQSIKHSGPSVSP